ncbi:MAG TPA: tetratricopeptide repeat protein [Candidatus Sulfopaludibacter sp.]|jgi:predicted CXXCH cytochrome family protein|nr:tetratricopeptide repeat protein [Candidatus Sulfopaludibacter sp.]
MRAVCLLLMGMALVPGALAADGYVDAAVCAQCHAEIAKTYRETGMGRSFFRMQPQTAVEDFASTKPFYHAPSDMYYRMVDRDGKYFQRRWQVGPDGKEINIEEKSVDFVMGSGNHGRTYLHLTARNTLQQLPLGWYAEKGGYWAMNPGYDRPDYPGSTRAISYECMACHNAYPQIPKGHEAEGAEAQFVTPLPEGIDCQRCHGPGQKHVEAVRRSGATAQEVRDAIVNPKRLSPEREMEVCLQCHLETSTQPLPHSIQRQGRGPFSYVPGQPLGDFRLAFDRAAPNRNRVEVAHAGYRLRQSQCFLKSSGKLRCTTCHNPHNIPRGEAATAQYNRVCRDCHGAVLANTAIAPKHTASGDCVSCHMPKRRTDDAVHIVMTDHWIQRRKPAGNLLAAKAESRDTAYKGEVVPYYPATLTGSTRDVLDRAVAQVRDGSNLKLGLPRLAALVERYHPAAAGYYVDLADAYRAAGDGSHAVEAFESALQKQPESEIMLLKLGTMLMDLQQWAKAETVYRRALAVAPDDAAAWGQLGWVLWQQDKTAEAKADLQKGIGLDSDLPDLHNYLAKLFIGTRDGAAAEREFRAALATEPGIAEWQANLAGLLLAKGDTAEAAYRFEESIKLKPDYAPAHLAYARMLVGMRRNAEAEQQARAAVESDANASDAHEFLGFLLVTKGDGAGALRELQAAVRLEPQFGRAQYELGVVLWQKGDAAPAVEHLQAAVRSGDPEAKAAAQQFLQKIGR